jgi:chromosome segregation ATPase
MAGQKREFSIQTRLLIMVTAVVVVLSAVLVYLGLERLYAYGEASAEYTGEHITAERKEQLKSLVDTVDSLFSKYHSRAESGEFSVAEAQSRMLRQIEAIRYADSKTLQEVGQGVRIVETVDEMFGKMIAEVEHLTQEVKELARQTNEVSTAVQDIAGTTEESTAAMQEVSSATEALNRMASELNEMVQRFRV